MFGGLAEFERSLTSERTVSALSHKKAHLQVYAPVPFGFQRDGMSLVPDSTEGQIVQQIPARRSAGETLRATAGWLNDSGVSTKRGTTWYASTIKAICGNGIHAVGDAVIYDDVA